MGGKKKGGKRNKCTPGPSNSYQSESGEELKQKEKRILVHSHSEEYKNGKILGIPDDDEQVLYFYPTEFHLVDLRDGARNRKWRHILPPLIEYAFPGNTVALDDDVYIFGGLYSKLAESTNFKLLQTDFYHNQLYMGGSRIHFDPDNCKGQMWGPAPIPTRGGSSINCVSLGKKIYFFGSAYVQPEVLDPAADHWKTVSLPHELADCRASHYALSDPSNKCIFLHLFGGQLSSPALYAFSPQDQDTIVDNDDTHSSDEMWKCVANKFTDWTHVAAAVEGVIYFHKYKYPNVIRAFDAASRKWLKVNWTSAFENNVDLSNRSMAFDALICLGNGILCFAGWTPVRRSDNTDRPRAKIFFYKFKVKRCGETISLIPHSVKSYEGFHPLALSLVSCLFSV